MQKKHLSLMVLLLAAVVFISGCGNKTDNPPVAENNSANNQSQEQNQAQVNNQTNETVNPSGSYTINELFSMNKPMKCTWKESVAKGDVTNVIYINGKKFYQDVTMGDVGHSFSVSDGEYLYIWNDFNDMASKMKNTQTQTGVEQKKDSAGLDQKKDFVCEGWVADDSIFAPPSDKNFKDVSEEMNQAVQGLNNGGSEKINKQICDACKNAPTQELKDKCMGDIKCD